MARPKLNIDPELVERMASIHCTMEEIASVVKCSVDTLERRFADVIGHARNKGKTSLRRKQWEVALMGNVPMLKWLGQQHLGQTDKIEEHSKREVKISGNLSDLPDADLINKYKALVENE